MENSTAQQYIEHYQDALDNTPEEVRDFLWSDAYKGIIAVIAKTCGLTPEQERVLSDVVFDITIGAIDQPEVDEKLTAADISVENQAKALALSAEYIIDPSITEAENLPENNEEGGAESIQPTIPSSSAPTPTQVLATLGARLNQSSVIVPSKRDYSMDTQSIEKPPVQNTTPSIDPYRELPEK